ncbi:hypothetical protein HYT52_03875 [Candidatus Woesearchaeota archaeon]|nr:hypothetical protein [Candidatus Woesearchaeota archaeon]
MLNKIIDWLNENSIEYKIIHHKPTRTSEESAKERNEDLSIGGKALVLKIDDTFKLFVLSAAAKLDSNAVKQQFNAKKLRFATAEELLKLTGLEPGSVPPFGLPIQSLDLYVDLSITKNTKIAFNAGSHTDSIIMQMEDYLKIAKLKIFSFSK